MTLERGKGPACSVRWGGVCLCPFRLPVPQPERRRCLSPVYPSCPDTAATVAERQGAGRRGGRCRGAPRPRGGAWAAAAASGERWGRGERRRLVLPLRAERRPSPLAVWRLTSRPPRRAANGRRAAPPPRACRAGAAEFPRGAGEGRRPPAPSSGRGAVRRRRIVVLPVSSPQSAQRLCTVPERWMELEMKVIRLFQCGCQRHVYRLE